MKLSTHDLPEIHAVASSTDASNTVRMNLRHDVIPGSLVRHRDDERSPGLCLGRRWGPKDRPMQCEVLWSVVPWILNIIKQDITTGSRQLNVTWNPGSLNMPGITK